MNSINLANTVECEKEVDKEIAAGVTKELMKVDEGITGSLDGVLMGLENIVEASVVGSAGPVDCPIIRGFELQDGPFGPRPNKSNVMEGREWKRLSILNKQQSSISDSLQQSSSTYKCKEKLEDEEDSNRVSKRKGASINLNDNSKQSQLFSSAVARSQHRRQP